MEQDIEMVEFNVTKASAKRPARRPVEVEEHEFVTPLETQPSRTEEAIDFNEKFISVLDQLDSRIERYRKDALKLQDRKDYLYMSIDIIKSNDELQNLSKKERDDINEYLDRLNARLETVDLHVRTIRDAAQQNSLSQINKFIDLMIIMDDRMLSQEKCQQFLNSCCSATISSTDNGCVEVDAGPIDKKFESALLGCTLDDQINIKKRLYALMGYLTKLTSRKN